MGKYDPAEIEGKWQKVWEQKRIYATPVPSAKRPKKYVLDMFPYPSGAGLHVGHIEGYTGTDIICRYLRMKGHSVLHPMGWDAFGLPAENYAIKNGIDPDKSTHSNIANFTAQIKLAGLSYDWEREIDSSSPNYYKYTQWIFTVLFKNGLAYKKRAPANWCPKDETVLANEQVVDGRCERCGTEVVQKELEQWFFKITDYADRLIDGLRRIDWPRSTKLQQENWIGRKEGINITYEVERSLEKIDVFTTRPDTNFGATFIVLAPEHELVRKIMAKDRQKEVQGYVQIAKGKKEVERISEGQKKTGVFTGAYAINKLNGYRMPIWVSDFVLLNVGTGALVGVPGHDVRDFQFAREFGLPVKRVVVGSDRDTSQITIQEQVQEEEGTMVNSGFLDGLDIHEATKKMMDFLEEKGWGKRVVTYHLRDWLISRQRYWGCPIPMIYCEKCGWNPVPDTDLPVLLPNDVDFRPHGESPIARSKTFQKGVRCPNCAGPARREVDTMDTFVDSSWYFWAFCFANKELMRGGKLETKAATNVFEKYKSDVKIWSPVDLYVGGAEHTVLHLMYSRFFWKAFYDLGYIDKSLGDEPFLKLRHPGTVLGPDGYRMSKSRGNVVNPDDYLTKYGADTLRVYEMFMGPFEQMKPWSVESVAGVYRFLARIYNLFEVSYQLKDQSAGQDLAREINKLIKKVEDDIETMSFNTAVAAMMEFLNEVQKSDKSDKSDVSDKSYTWKAVWEKFLLVLAPFAPHLSEELWQRLQKPNFHELVTNPSTFLRSSSHESGSSKFISIHQRSWPEVNDQYLRDQTITIVVSVNGKPRGTLELRGERLKISQNEFEEMAKAEPNVAKWLEGKEIKKVVYVAGKIVNFVV